jgi:hypothetical protein
MLNPEFVAIKIEPRRIFTQKNAETTPSFAPVFVNEI